MTAGWRGRAAVAAASLLLLGLILFLGWPGRIGSDEADMLRQAEAGAFHDWHSPLIAWLWSLGLRVTPGPASAFVAGAGLYVLGFHSVATGTLASGRRLLCWASIALAAFPLTAILAATAGSKDLWLTGAMLLAVGALLRLTPANRRRVAAGVLASACLATAIRPNAVFAIVPLLAALVWAWPGRAAGGGARRVAVALGAGIVLAPVLYAATAASVGRALDVRRSHVAASLMIFDLAGISVRTGTDASAGRLGPAFVPSLAECYTPRFWDHYALWGGCPETWRHLFGEALIEAPGQATVRADLFDAWRKAVVSHPAAYAGHRLAHFGHALGFDPLPGWRMPVIAIDPPTWPPDRRAAALMALDRFATSLAEWPVFKPYAGLAAGLIALSLLFRIPPSRTRLIALTLLASGFAYALGYLLVGVASALRYSHWTLTAVALGLAWTGAAVAEARRSTSPAD